MKNLGSTIFPLTLTTLLAGLTYGLQWHVQSPLTQAYVAPQHKPAAIVTGGIVQRVDESGRLRFRLSSPYMLQYQDDESSWLDHPTLENYRPDKATTTLRADSAMVNNDVSTVVFTGNVVMYRPAYANEPDLQAHMDSLEIFPDDAKARTSSQIEIKRGESLLKGVGMEYDNDRLLFTLHRQVSAFYPPHH